MNWSEKCRKIERERERERSKWAEGCSGISKIQTADVALSNSKCCTNNFSHFFFLAALRRCPTSHFFGTNTGNFVFSFVFWPFTALHLINIIVNSMNSVLVFVVAKQLCLTLRPFQKEDAKHSPHYILIVPFVTALLHAVHPVKVEATANVTHGCEVLANFCQLCR